MKNLDAYMKGLYVSLEGIDEVAKEKLSNIEGYQITECCCGYCDCECPYDQPACAYEEPVAKQIVVNNQFGRFNSEEEVIRELDTKPTVVTLYDIHNQFSKFMFVKDVKRDHTEPLYFGYKNYSICGTSGESVNRENGDMPPREVNSENTEQLYDVVTIQNKKIYKVVTDIVESFNLVCPVIETKINGEVQVYTAKHCGTNGKENSIKSSLEEIADILGKLDKKSEVQWSQVLDVAIDNIDDLYGFVITFVLDPEKVRETIKPEKT